MSKIVIIGGGASGLISAIYASKNNDVTILERNESCGKKILVTGNGRCNYFNEDNSLSHYHSTEDINIKEIINKNNLDEVLSFFNKVGIVPRIRNGYYYPYTNQAITIKESLLNEVKNNNIKIINNFLVEDIIKDNDKFIIKGNNKELIFDKVIISTGSLSYPKTGSTGMGYDFLKKFNHKIIKPLPALVQLISNYKYMKKWSGIRTEVILKLESNNEIIKVEQGELQLTDYGISGICTFNLSSFIARNLSNNIKQYIHINFIPFLEDNKLEYFNKRNNLLNNPSIYNLLNGIINNKLIEILLKESNIKETNNWNNLSIEEKNTLINNITDLKIEIIDTKSFDNSQICSGGLSLNEINMSTMESKNVKDLFVTGELLDLFGDCGGYNLTIAWITGMIAGTSAGDNK